MLKRWIFKLFNDICSEKFTLNIEICTCIYLYLFENLLSLK